MRWSIRWSVVVAMLVVVVGLAAAPTGKGPKDFTVFPVGRPFRLSEAKGKFVALHFLLKTECPYCLNYTHEYASKAGLVPDVVHVFLKPDAPEATAEWLVKTDAKDAVTVYQDEGAKLATAYGVPDGYKFHGQRVRYPALILLDGEGNEVYRYVGKDNTDRLPFEQFEAKVKELRGTRE